MNIEILVSRLSDSLTRQQRLMRLIVVSHGNVPKRKKFNEKKTF